ncbi:MAG: hypothetical protein LQ350_008138 [Teloschistes chrysophthalmus]|nr:MAG: hypothetical protein LQ350_008138 [Niorma chrysophthalma]
MANEGASTETTASTGTFFKLGCQCGRWMTWKIKSFTGYDCECGLPERSKVRMQGSSRNEINVSSCGVDLCSSGLQVSRIVAKEIHISGLDVNIFGPHIMIRGEKIDISAVRFHISGDGTKISGSDVKISAGSIKISGNWVTIKGNKVEMSAPTVSVTGAGFGNIVTPKGRTDSSSDNDFSDDDFLFFASNKKSTGGHSKNTYTNRKPEDFPDEGYKSSGRRPRTRGRSNSYPPKPEPKPEEYASYWEYVPKGEQGSQGPSSGANRSQGQQERPSDWWKRNGAAPKPKASDYRESGNGEETKSKRQQQQKPQEKAKPSSTPEVKKNDGFVDFYALLGLSPSCSQAEIEKVVKRKRIQYHPDKLKKEGMTTEELQFIDEQAKLVGGAADVLADPIQRRRYDDKRQANRYA